jgi:hypothetical protein
MDRDTALEAHPAFVEILRQLTPDEAKIVGQFAVKRPFPLITVRADMKAGGGGVDVLRHFSLIGEEAGCLHPTLTPSYLDNLCRLGLADIPAFMTYTTPGTYEPLEQHAFVRALIATVEKDFQDRTARIERKGLIVTSFGRQFCQACVVDREHG